MGDKKYHRIGPEREAWARELFAQVPEMDRMIVGATHIAQVLNGWGLRTFHANVLVSAEAVKRWARQGRIPTVRGLGGRLGWSHSTTLFTLLTWLLRGDQRCVRLPRRPRTVRPPARSEGRALKGLSGRRLRVEERAVEAAD